MIRHFVGPVLAGLLLAGCPVASPPGGRSSDVDAERLALLKREAVLQLAVGDPYTEAGFRVSGKLPPHRGKVTADLTKPADVGQDLQRAVQAMGLLRGGGWTVFHTRCGTILFTATAYKVVDGVSFYAQLDGSDVQDGQNLVLQMRAPQSEESTSDLFPERPAALAVGTTCLETNSISKSEGTAIELDELAPDPDGPTKSAGHR